jgi:nucleotide-binding universal stress UspA family protein
MKMQKMRKILVPIDFTLESGRALRDAVALGKETGSQVVALHVIDEKAERDVLLSAIAPVDGLPFFLDSYATVPVDVLRRERTLDLWNFVAQYAGRMQQERVRKVIRMGKLTREITTFMQDEAVDLLVLKQRQRRLFPDLTMLKLVTLAGRLSCPVLLDPPAPRERPEPRNGLLAFDLLEQARLLWNLRTSEH